MSDVFLGMPPPDITRQMISNVFWRDFMTNLEDFNNSQDKLPAVGSYIKVPYKVDPDGSPVDTDWQILGYNGSIPKYVKYKDEAGNRVYVDIFPNESPIAPLITDFTTAKAYANKDGTTLVGDVTNPSGTFTYGQTNASWGTTETTNGSYSVPTSITVNSTDYTFAGYNVTVMPKLGLAAKYNGKLYMYAQFDSENHNDWKTSEIREWLNGTEAILTQLWAGSSSVGYTTGTIAGLLGRLPDQNFMKNIIPTVNRTWVHSFWRTDQTVAVETYVDKFWLLGEGNVNGDNSNLKDDLYDTSKFTYIFTNNNSRIRKDMNEDGTEGSASFWWLRSASSSSSDHVGYIFNSGIVSNAIANGIGAVLPACLIG